MAADNMILSDDGSLTIIDVDDIEGVIPVPGSDLTGEFVHEPEVRRSRKV